jgi:hypothetical protein
MTFSDGCRIAASGRYWGRSGHGVATANRSFVTHYDILPPSIDALQKSQLSSLTGQEHGRTVPFSRRAENECGQILTAFANSASPHS